MIQASYFVTCDGEHPEIEDELCEAEFTYDALRLSDVAGLRLQLKKRGWTFQRNGERGKALCPLHRQEARVPHDSFGLNIVRPVDNKETADG